MSQHGDRSSPAKLDIADATEVAIKPRCNFADQRRYPRRDLQESKWAGWISGASALGGIVSTPHTYQGFSANGS